jgi:hypothetical protein
MAMLLQLFLHYLRDQHRNPLYPTSSQVTKSAKMAQVLGLGRQTLLPGRAPSKLSATKTVSQQRICLNGLPTGDGCSILNPCRSSKPAALMTAALHFTQRPMLLHLLVCELGHLQLVMKSIEFLSMLAWPTKKELVCSAPNRRPAQLLRPELRARPRRSTLVSAGRLRTASRSRGLRRLNKLPNQRHNASCATQHRAYLHYRNCCSNLVPPGGMQHG